MRKTANETRNIINKVFILYINEYIIYFNNNLLYSFILTQMSTLENVIIKGDLTIQESGDTADQGFGDIYIQRNAAVTGTTAATNSTTGALVVSGGFGIAGAVFADSTMDVNGATTLDQTTIDTTDGQFAVSGSNKVSMTPSAAIELTGAANSFLKTTAGTAVLESQASSASVLGNTSVSVTSSAGAVNLSAAATSSYATSSGNITVQSSTGVLNLLSSSNTNITSSAASVSINGNAASDFSVTGAFPLTLTSSGGSVILSSQKTSTDSITLDALTGVPGGGILIDVGTNGVDMNSNGAIKLDASNVASNFTLSTNGASQDLTIGVTGTTDSSLILNSSGTNTDAIIINASNATSGINIDSGSGGLDASTTGGMSLNSQSTSNFTVTGASNLTLRTTGGNAILQGGSTGASAVTITADNAAGGINIDSGTNGVTMDTTGGISLDSASTSNFTVTGTSNLTVASTAGDVIVNGGSTNATAVNITASNAAGGINIGAGTNGIVSSTTGGTAITSVLASSMTVNTAASGQNLTLGITGATASSLILNSSGTGIAAIDINATAGGIDIDATSEINLQTTDSVNGVKIATGIAGIPITIGNSTTSTVTIGRDLVVAGDLTVSGTTTTVNTATVTVEDNIIVYNSAPAGTADGGMAIKRFQRSTGGSTDDIVSDTPSETSATHGGPTQAGTTASTIKLNAGASAVTNAYSGYWIKITSGAHSGDVRRIQSYNGTTKVATIYATGDTDPSYPGQELNFSATLSAYDAQSYSLYGNVFITSVYDESADKWILATVPLEPSVSGQITPLKYIDFQAGNIYSTGAVYTNTINAFSGTAVTISGVTIDSGALTGVTTINGNSPDSLDIVVLADNTTGVLIPSTTTTGSFLLIVEANYVGGANAIFLATKSDSADANEANRIASSKGATNNERILATWEAGQKLKLKFQSTPGTATTYSYKVKVVSP
jgi:hypothetical protein